MCNVIKKYKKEQPVINNKRQLSRKVVNEDVRSVLEQTENITFKHLCFIDTIMTFPKTTLENKIQLRITAINAITAYCRVEEEMSYRSRQRGRPVCTLDITLKAKDYILVKPNTVIEEAKVSVQTQRRP